MAYKYDGNLRGLQVFIHISGQLGRLSGRLSTKPCLLNAPHSSTFVHQHKLELQTKLWRPMTGGWVSFFWVNQLYLYDKACVNEPTISMEPFVLLKTDAKPSRTAWRTFPLFVFLACNFTVYVVYFPFLSGHVGHWVPCLDIQVRGVIW